MTAAAYAEFLPENYRSAYREPESTWWEWRGRRVHIARDPRPDAPVRVMGIHGAGGHSAALWSFASLAADDDVDILFPDMPVYGRTVEPRPSQVRYCDWIDLLCDLVAAERADDPRPLVLFGASMGGMMAYEVAARTGQVAAVIATCLLDPGDAEARAAAARWGFAGRVAPSVLPPVARVAGDLRLPIRWLVRMNRMSNDRDLTRMCESDSLGGGVRIPLGFLADWFTYPHTAPEDFTAVPVTLVHPAADRWTPPEPSLRFLDRISGPTQAVLLENCGHWPIEEPGLTRLIAATRAVIAGVAEQA